MTDQTIALVTGATRGLGHATALGLARRGAHVVALARTTGALEELADAIDETPGSSTLVPLDVTDDDGLARMCRAIHDRWGRLDLLVHCAAHAAPLSMADHVTAKDLDRCMAVNARATQRLIFMCAPLLRAAPAGHAVFAIDDRAGEPFFGAYGASKAAAGAIAESWRRECERIGPKVTLFRPAPMPTGLRARFFPGEDRGVLAAPADEAERLLSLL
ncbi:SDR family NAD(P)-dependent oxidoreductase [Rhodobacteraceae bacterium 2CG4]|uniref:SDR family NAD(P)-dependent oxidoreductase n=1 Tax=Halovulum marinum TaxID=2662447 RepID=A0A6L5YYQ6_9RHOB|nr:SDR family oxidoreductase [Halovulum marinum]MSU88975.1 SDR family NAD(P)-dependent oxidoreductase [Halovulum marinum]